MVTEVNTLAADTALGHVADRRTRRWRWLSGGLVVVVCAAIIGLQWPLDYFAFQPGSATATSPLIEVDGVERFEPEGTLYFTTVASREVTVWDFITDRFDPSVDLISKDEILQGRTQQQRRDDNIQAMMSSQETAELVALQYLGYEVFEVDGALIAAVEPDTAADGVLEVGDVVVGIDGVDVETRTDLTDVLADRTPGDGIELLVRPVGESVVEARAMVLGSNDDGGAFMGVGVVTDVRPRDDLPFDVEIDAGNVGGPSAGLAWTLTVIDLLTEGELTGGKRVAITGTIAIDGSVGPIGGVVQKTYAVREQGIDVFLVPEADEAAALEHAGDDLIVVGVADLDEAIEALDSIGGEVSGLAGSAAG